MPVGLRIGWWGLVRIFEPRAIPRLFPTTLSLGSKERSPENKVRVDVAILLDTFASGPLLRRRHHVAVKLSLNDSAKG